MGMRVIRPDLERWQLDLDGVRSRMYLAPTPRERERWHALSLLCRGMTASASAQALAGMLIPSADGPPPSASEVRRL